jgi:hypothetical protein
MLVAPKPDRYSSVKSFKDTIKTDLLRPGDDDCIALDGLG